MITLYGTGSPNVLKVLIMLRELALPFDFVPVDVYGGQQHGDEFRNFNPNRKVPVLVDATAPGVEPLVVWESGAILNYLAEREGKFLPVDIRQRAITIQWLMFQMASVGPMFGQLIHFRLYTSGPELDYARIRYSTEVYRIHDVLEERLKDVEYLDGSAYSIADIATWSWIRSSSFVGIEIGEYPSVKRWHDQIGARAPVAEAAEVINELNRKLDVAKLLRDRPEDMDRYLGRGKYARPIID